jgi:FAD/FMN-containing dehydrogenase
MDILIPDSGIIGRVLRRGDEGYEHYRQWTCWHARVPERYPEAIVVATSDADVVGAVTLARAEGLSIAVRSGGHSWGASHLRDGSVLIDMSNLRRTELDVENMTLIAEPGVKGSEVTLMLAAHDLFFPTGHNEGISLGGYLLQGGYAWAGRDYGPACMSVTAIDAVTAEGELVHASETDNADLLWAARGAGAGFFAVVTRFYMTVYPRHTVTMTSTYVFPIACAKDLVSFIHDVARDSPAEVIGLVRRDEETGENRIMLSVTAFTDSVEDARAQLEYYETFPRIAEAIHVDAYRETDHWTMTHQASGDIDETKRWIADNVATHAPAADMWPTLEKVIETFPPYPSHLAIFNWSGREGEPERPDMAFSVDDELYYAIYSAWDDAADDEKWISWTSEHTAAWEPFASGTMLADENLEYRPSDFVTREKLRRLDEVRARWDRDKRFVSWLGRPDAG